MLTIRRSGERGHFDHGWLDTYHTFSFADYHDRRHMGFGPLRVINEDRVQPGTGFGEHPHRDMEIVTYVLSGELEHRDSLGHRGLIGPGEIQYMAAGAGILHSEFNPSADQVVHLLQIWIRPNRRGMPPTYAQREFPALADAGRLVLLASPDGAAGSIAINQDARVYAARLRGGDQVTHTLATGRQAWVQVARGSLRTNGESLAAGDGAAVTGETMLRLQATEDSELLLFDLPPSDARGR